jgi:Zn-dependent protease
MFGVSETPYEVRFPFLGIPVRVHPLFWLVAAMLGWRRNDLPAVLIWVACVFISILIHEYGHGSVARSFGSRPWILLWGGGGLCLYHDDRETPAQRLAVLISGPGAGFLLCGLVLLLVSALVGVTPREHLSVIQRLTGFDEDPSDYASAHLKLRTGMNFRVYSNLIWINLMWGLVNLLPIWPLDGGGISKIVLSHFNPRDGARWAHTVSLLVAGALAFAALSYWQDYFLTFIFGFFAFLNYQRLQNIYHAHRLGISSDEDWWGR